MTKIKLEKVVSDIDIKVGKKTFRVIDMTMLISLIMGCSKSKAKKLLKDGAVDLEVKTK